MTARVLAGWALWVATAAAEPVRVATLLPAVDDALARIGGDVTVVATVRRQLHRPAAADRGDLGSPHAPNLEALGAARADLVVGDQALHGGLRDRLAALAGEVVLVRTDSVDHTLDDLAMVGERVGAEPAMRALIEQSRTRLAAARGRAVPVLVVFGTPGAFMVVTPRSWLGDLVRVVGLHNVAPSTGGTERHPGFVQFDDEALSALRPEYVLLVGHGDPTAIEAALRARLAPGGALAALGAVVAGRVRSLPADLFSANPGLALADAGIALRAASEAAR